MSNVRVVTSNLIPPLKSSIEEAIIEKINITNKETLKYIDDKNEELSKNISNDIDILVTEVAKLELKSNKLEDKLYEHKTVFYITYIILGVLLIFSLVFNIINYKIISQKSEIQNQILTEQVIEEAPTEEVLAP